MSALPLARIAQIVRKGGAVVVAIVVAAPFLAGCPASEPAEDAALETVEVGDPTAALTPDDDPVAAPRGRKLVGVLPSHFPRDLPRPESVSVTDFSDAGATGSGATAFVVLSSTRGVVELTRWFEERLRPADGWRQESTGRFRHAGRGARITVSAGRPGETLLRYEYPSPG